VALQFDEVVVVELRGFQPFDRAEGQRLSGDGFAVGADDVDQEPARIRTPSRGVVLDFAAIGGRPRRYVYPCRLMALGGGWLWAVIRSAEFGWKVSR
jgi:hypothetical protein